MREFKVMRYLSKDKLSSATTIMAESDKEAVEEYCLNHVNPTRNGRSVYPICIGVIDVMSTEFRGYWVTHHLEPVFTIEDNKEDLPTDGEG